MSKHHKSHQPQPTPQPAETVSAGLPSSTKHLIFGLVLTAIILVFAFILHRLRVFPPVTYTSADFDIDTYISSNDQDQDGIDDQTDIIVSALSYLATEPKYQSIYYSTGYPDDNHGVCTDVVAFALLGAGYNLRDLVHQDITEHPDAYNIETPDRNIDFRRVNNLYTYFKRHFTSLTTDTDDHAAWQGGDIVVYPTHIGIVSDQRNRYGVPLLIHHDSPLQIRYEEDILADYDQIIGHFRLSAPKD